MKVAVIGGGWYGAHIALTLQKAGHAVTIFEKNKRIFNEVSGQFSIRLRAGPHYPRSKATRESCQQGLAKFLSAYQELINEHEYSMYGLGITDADGQPSKVSRETFAAICDETPSGEINIDDWGYQNLHSAWGVDEPSVKSGGQLERFFKRRLEESGVRVTYECKVSDVSPNCETRGVTVHFRHGEPELFGHVVNATGYQSVLPVGRPLPFNMKIIYQPCLALVYQDKTPGEKPFSFIVMDKWFLCLVPYDDGERPANKYIITHGKWTIMDSHKTVREAQHQLHVVDEAFIEDQVRPNCEREMCRFWPAFADRFHYLDWEGAVLAKEMDNRFRSSAVVFQTGNSNITYVFPGEVSKVCDAAEEVAVLVQPLEGQVTRTQQGIGYVRDGTLGVAALTQYFEVRRKVKNIVRGFLVGITLLSFSTFYFLFCRNLNLKDSKFSSIPTFAAFSALFAIVAVLLKVSCRYPFVKHVVNQCPGYYNRLSDCRLLTLWTTSSVRRAPGDEEVAMASNFHGGP